MTDTAQSEITSSGIWQRRSALLGAAIVLAVFWCGVLPWIATQPRMQRQLKFLDKHGIDPSAMFYTELDAMDGILQKTNVR